MTTLVSDVAHRAIDGQVATLSNSIADLSQPAASVAVYQLSVGRQVEFTSTSQPESLNVARDLGVPQLDEQYETRGGVLHIGHGEWYDADAFRMARLHYALWQGKRASLQFFLYNATTSDVLRVFDMFDVDEDDQGVKCVPRRTFAKQVSTARPAEVIKDVANIGLVEVTRASARRRRELPSWGGHVLRGGHLYVQKRGEPSMTLLLVNESALCQILPSQEILDTGTITSELADLRVSWF